MPSDGRLPFEEFCKRYATPRPGRTLIVGSKLYEGHTDRRAAFSDAIGVDMLPGAGVDVVANLEEPLPNGLGNFDHIECCSVLEHARRPWKLAANLQRMLNPLGSLLISAPMVWRIHGYPDDYFRFTPNGVRSLFDRVGWVKICIASDRLKQNDLVPSVEVEGHPYFARAEVVGFGVKQ